MKEHIAMAKVQVKRAVLLEGAQSQIKILSSPSLICSFTVNSGHILMISTICGACLGGIAIPGKPSEILGKIHYANGSPKSFKAICGHSARKRHSLALDGIQHQKLRLQ